MCPLFLDLGYHKKDARNANTGREGIRVQGVGAYIAFNDGLEKGYLKEKTHLKLGMY
jgi:hypothetical protein